MVFFVLSRAGYDELESLVGSSPLPIWVNAGVLSAQEVDALRAKGVDLSCFSDVIDPLSTASICNSIAIISEHHPGQRIWVEHRAEF